MNKIGIVLLAAGESARMGTPKQLLSFLGQPLVRHAATIALASECGPVAVVLGAGADSIQPALDGLDLLVTINSRWSEGMGTSIQSGLMALANHPVDAVILSLADQPLLTPRTYERLVRAFETTRRSIVTSEYSDTVGVPVLFAREHFAELMALPPDRGCKGVILRHLESAHRIPCPEAEADLDTPADYQRIRSDEPTLQDTTRGEG